MKNYPRNYTTKQRRSFDCGIACAVNILRYLGKEVSRKDFNDLLKDKKIKKRGASMWDLINRINEFGFNAQGVMCDFDALVHYNSCPAIIAVEVLPEVFHYVIVYEVDETSVVVADPSILAARIAKMPLHKFSKRYHWGGEAIIIS